MNALNSFTKQWGNWIWSTVLDAVFPPHCMGCGEWCREPFCRFCTPKLKVVTAPLCQACGRPFDPLAFPAPLCKHCRAKRPSYLAARAGYDFDGPPRKAIHRLKYRGKTALAPRIAPLMKETLDTDVVLRDFHPDFLVPIPLHPKRLRERGFNQSQLLAKELGKLLGVPVVTPLTRVRDTAPQIKLKRPERARNVRDAFAVDLTVFHTLQGKEKKFLLIDDVLTTGATLDEATRMLKKAGAAEVCALTLARRD